MARARPIKYVMHDDDSGSEAPPIYGPFDSDVQVTAHLRRLSRPVTVTVLNAVKRLRTDKTGRVIEEECLSTS